MIANNSITARARSTKADAKRHKQARS